MNSFGTIFRLSLWGESHGVQVGVSIDGVPAGIPLSEKDFEHDLARRRAGAEGTTARCEKDIPRIVSGIFEGVTTGAPLTIVFENHDARSADYSDLRKLPRPSHADFTAAVKFGGHNDYRGGGHFSGRMTLAITAAGVVAKKILGPEVRFSTSTAEIAGYFSSVMQSGVIESALVEGDTLGGVVQCRINGAGTGLGEPFFDSVESTAAHLLFSIPAVKGVEFGAGFLGTLKRGSEYNDSIVDSSGRTSSNNDGGVNGGITNGNTIVVRAAIKPAASILKPQQSFDFAAGEPATIQIRGRHDVCIALRAAVVVEAAMAIALADLKLRM
ncbi:MAG: chorismate synthase [Alistipes sp.]|nr:chorismate synthase [Alistipes sp.]